MRRFGVLLGLGLSLFDSRSVSAFSPSSAFGVCRSVQQPSFLNSAVEEETTTSSDIISPDKIR